MFTKIDEKNLKEAETIIGPSLKVKGDFSGKGNIIVEGVLEGSLKTSSNLFIGDDAKITASLEANEARVGGEINGNIKTHGHLEISSSSRINGDIDCSSISIARGAILNGKCIMNPNSNHPNKDIKDKN